MYNSAPTRPILRYFGGKWRIAPWIISHFPDHEIYVESYGGAAAVLLRKPRNRGEIYNDLDSEIVNLFRVCRDRGEDLQRALYLTPYAREEFDGSFIPDDHPVEQARRTLIRSYMGYGNRLTKPNRDQTPQRTGFRNYSGNGRNATSAQDWSNYPDALTAIIERLRGVIIENRDARQVMADHDSSKTLHYVDPPYVWGTRKERISYRYEMTDADHIALAEFLRGLRGMVIISGYDCPLYQELYRGWRSDKRRTMADGARVREETIWISPNTPARQGRLF